MSDYGNTNPLPGPGLARTIRRRLQAGLALVLAFAGLVVALAFFALPHLDPQSVRAYFLGSLLALGSVLLGELLALRLVSRPLQALHHLEESEASFLTFLEKVFHSLRSSLAAIMGYGELLSDPSLWTDRAFQQKFARTIAKEGRQIVQITEDALLVAHLERSHRQAEAGTFQLDELLARLIAESRSQRKREICFENRLGQVFVAGETFKWCAAIRHLVDNALKYSPPDRPVEVVLQAGQQPGWIEILVRDYGIGISESERQLLFRRFGRIRNEHTRGIPGSGLGLYIANHIVENYRGAIRVQSQPGQGSTFTISLPLSLSGAAGAGRVWPQSQ